MSSWWADPSVQRDRDAFRLAQQAQEPRWLAQREQINTLTNRLQTVDWGVATPKRGGFGLSNRIGVTP